jgi:hypothetical protein
MASSVPNNFGISHSVKKNASSTAFSVNIICYILLI